MGLFNYMEISHRENMNTCMHVCLFVCLFIRAHVCARLTRASIRLPLFSATLVKRAPFEGGGGENDGGGGMKLEPHPGAICKSRIRDRQINGHSLTYF